MHCQHALDASVCALRGDKGDNEGYLCRQLGGSVESGAASRTQGQAFESRAVPNLCIFKYSLLAWYRSPAQVFL